jgi:hypothetical protein
MVFMGLWVYGFMGLWVYGFMKLWCLWVYTPMYGYFTNVRVFSLKKKKKKKKRNILPLLKHGGFETYT